MGLYLTGTLGMTATLPQILFYLGLASFEMCIRDRCNLLGIEDADELAMHPQRGAVFETAVVSELM